MAVQIACPYCKTTGKVPEEYLGRSLRCKRCSTRFTIKRALGAPVPDRLLPERPVALEDMPAVLVDLPR